MDINPGDQVVVVIVATVAKIEHHDLGSYGYTDLLVVGDAGAGNDNDFALEVPDRIWDGLSTITKIG